jgi:putative hydrolase of HD superfamily
VSFVSFVVPPPNSVSLAAQRLVRQIEFIAECDKLKEIFRQTLNTQSRRAENDAEHSWHLCLCVITLAEHANAPGLDVLRVLKMLIVHDLVEIDAGDTFAYDPAAMAGQHAREVVAAERIFGLLPADQAAEFRALWDEFEAKQTPEAKFATACDRFQPMLLNCRTQGEGWRRHGVTHDRVVARNRPIAEGSAELWRHAEQMLAEIVAAGHLPAGPK